MILQFDEIVSERQTGWHLRFDRKIVFIAQTVGKVDEQDGTIDVPDWLAFKEGLEGYEV